MKYNTLKASFKDGMISARLRGREKDGGINSGAEKLENFYIDRVGAAIKRAGIKLPEKQPFLNSGEAAARYDSHPLADTVDTTFFAVNLKGREFIFRFNKTKAINAIVNETNPTSVAHFQSTFLHVINPDDGSYYDTRPFAPFFTATSGYTANGDLTAFNYSQGAPVLDTQLDNYLHQLTPAPTHMAKVSDATVVFTCGNENNSISNISFTVSLINLPVTAGQTPTTEVFVILPYFVNIRAFVANLGKSVVDTDYYIPIQPLSFPFNVVNPNKAFQVNVAVLTGQSGSATADSVLAVPGDKLSWVVTVPQDICIDSTFAAGVYINSDALIGKFISVPDSTNVRDVVFFITKYESSPSATTFRFYAIQVTGGVAEANSTRWKVSTFGGQTHPRAVKYSFGRLIYGNAGIDQSKWWASGIHPSNLTNFQGFMGFSLTQDATSDVSHMLNEGISSPAATDPYRYGFEDRVPNLAPISFIDSRRRIHFGTLNGECQLDVTGSAFNKISYTQFIIRTNSAALANSVSGDGKFFYIANSGKDIRFISTEDKDYESVDGLVTTALEGLGLIFTKILWFEKLSSLVVMTSDNRVFLIAMHEDTQIKAISELVSELDIIDICVTLESLFFVYKYKSFIHVSKYAPTQHTSLTTTKDSLLGGDLAVMHPSVTGNITYSDLYPFYLGGNINIFFNGVEYTVAIPIGYTAADPTSIILPFNINAPTYTNPAFFYGEKVTAKLRTMPITDGGGNDSAVGDTTRVDRAVVLVDLSGPFKLGTEDGTKYDAEGVVLTELRTKYVKHDMPQSNEIENHLYIETDKPTPLNISGVSYRGVSNNGA